MRTTPQPRWATTMLLALVCACGGPASVEEGAVLITVTKPDGWTQAPDHLRVSVFDDSGALFRDERLPRTGALSPAKAGTLGTVFIQLGAVRGVVRVHLRAMAADTFVGEAVLKLSAGDIAKGRVEAPFSGARPDDDKDGVPDEIDDCPVAANPAQTGCPPGVDGGPIGWSHADAAPDISQRTPDAAVVSVDTSPLPDARLVDRPSPDVARPLDTMIAGLPNGSACTSASLCSSGFCADGVCCERACDGECETCRAGVCEPVRNAMDPPMCVAPFRCNGAGKCRMRD